MTVYTVRIKEVLSDLFFRIRGSSGNVADVTSSGEVKVKVSGGGGTNVDTNIHDSAGGDITATGKALDVNIKSGLANPLPISGSVNATCTGTVAVSSIPAVAGTVAVSSYPAPPHLNSTDDTVSIGGSVDIGNVKTSLVVTGSVDANCSGTVNCGNLPDISNLALENGHLNSIDNKLSSDLLGGNHILRAEIVDAAGAQITTFGQAWNNANQIGNMFSWNNANQIGNTAFTANAGTNLNTSALALETGGNLAAIKLKTDNIPASPATSANQQPAATAIPEYNVALTLANTGYSQALPDHTKQIAFRNQAPYSLRYAFTPSKVDAPTAPYFTLDAGVIMTIDKMDLSSKTIYFASAHAGDVAELLVLT